ncbi:hypothetical protein ONA24_03750 [Mycoplasmopsis cynos]|nr:hypothetical protein [Mycoplasmopsis cynos]UWV93597.1 hypothetical protein NW062_06860 [Mycoplasmopsis cynos]WAM02959.1 hypothetical protein ONA22_03860 [Mycoplasmopsis cynos]WAM06108.1 hypothetical protein ONA23_03635 [Mycoplasmopsis cynos]WAM09210.1 hypothetical protein ONA24_03750 [Mycoplasmopsis cynos]
MYKYKARLLSNSEIVAKANSLEELEGLIKGFRRGKSTVFTQKQMKKLK